MAPASGLSHSTIGGIGPALGSPPRFPRGGGSSQASGRFAQRTLAAHGRIVFREPLM